MFYNSWYMARGDWCDDAEDKKVGLRSIKRFCPKLPVGTQNTKGLTSLYQSRVQQPKGIHKNRKVWSQSDRCSVQQPEVKHVKRSTITPASNCTRRDKHTRKTIKVWPISLINRAFLTGPNRKQGLVCDQKPPLPGVRGAKKKRNRWPAGGGGTKTLHLKQQNNNKNKHKIRQKRLQGYHQKQQQQQ